MGVTIWQVDAFTNRPFAGNPAAVCFLDQERPDSWMQSLAAEMNLSETAFLLPRDDGWSLRWFTPKLEVDLCGHATLASAHALWQSGRLAQKETARFHTRSGVLTARRQGGWIEMDFPAEPCDPIEPPAELLAALGVDTRYVGQNRWSYLVEVAGEADVRALAPDFVRLAAQEIGCAIVTGPAASSEFDFVSRCFVPGAGIDEDPVTGSAHCCLGPFWAERLGKKELVGYQASARGGVVRVRMEGRRVKLAGQAVCILRGELCP